MQGFACSARLSQRSSGSKWRSPARSCLLVGRGCPPRQPKQGTVKKDYQTSAAPGASPAELGLTDEVSVAIADLAETLGEGLLALAGVDHRRRPLRGPEQHR